MINTIWGSTEKPISTKRLADKIGQIADLEGTLYIGYPIIGTPEGSFPIDALLVLKEKGVVLFNVIEGKHLGDYEDAQDDAFNKMQAKLLQHKILIQKRKLIVDIRAVTYAPTLSAVPVNPEYAVCNSDNLIEVIRKIPNVNSDSYGALVSVIQSISTLRRGRKKRDLQIANSRGMKIKSLEDSIANLDSQQSAAVVETFEGVQRIRGLAGCGKTIVLALKVAYLHASHRDWSIAVTFNTRSLKKQFENLITTFVLEQVNEEPDWEKIRILNAWGAPGGKERTGIYYEFCNDHGVEYLDFGTAKNQYGSDKAFEKACEIALTSVKTFIPKYDAILIDEAQDFSPSFLLLCYEYLKDPKRLVYAYDELQNLGNRSLPPAEEIFGKDTEGHPRVTIEPPKLGRPKQDIILDTCYRNSRPVLSTAHALGFGIYRERGLVQVFENKNLWFDIGYEGVKDRIDDGEIVELSRTLKSSPEFLEHHSSIDDLIEFRTFETEEEQTTWLVKAIQENLEDDELIPDDIVVINPEPLSTRNAVGSARAQLLKKKINSNLAGVTTIADVFTEPGTVTFTGVFRAKGNEAAMVYVINAQDCFGGTQPREVALSRNRLFTAMTRSKAWVRVLGFGPRMKSLSAEFEKVKRANFSLKFRYPTEDERKSIMTVNRDMSKAELERSNNRRNSLADIARSLDSGESYLEDYSEDDIALLRSVIDKKVKRKNK